MPASHREPLRAGGRRNLARRQQRGVPGAGVLAVVAPEDPVAELFLDRVGDRTAVLDRPVRQASARVEQSGCDERVGRARLETADAGAAPLGDRIVGGDVQIRYDFGEEKERPELGVDQAAVLPDPAETGGRGKRALRQRRRIDADPPVEAAVETRMDGLRDADGAGPQRPVVIGSPGIARDARSIGSDERLRAVGRGEADDGPRAGEQPLRRGADRRRLLEVLHPGVTSLREPFPEPVEARRGLGARDAAAGKALPSRLLPEKPRRERAIGSRGERALGPRAAGRSRPDGPLKMFGERALGPRAAGRSRPDGPLKMFGERALGPRAAGRSRPVRPLKVCGKRAIGRRAAGRSRPVGLFRARV